MVACQASPSIARRYLRNLLLMRFERRNEFAVPTELEIDGDLEFEKPKRRRESVTLEVVNSFLLETPRR